MIFSSILFLFLFLPIVLLLYYISRNNIWRNIILTIASLFFYAYGEPIFVFVMLGMIFLDFFLTLCMDKVSSLAKKRLLLVLACVLNLSVLFVFKYLDFSILTLNTLFHIELPLRNIALPIGISFFTFQALSYVIDVYRGTAGVQKNPLNLILYISFFPQLIAGPIVRYNTIEEQIRERKTTLTGFSEGARRFMIGFVKKVVIANNCAVAATRVFAAEDISSQSVLFLWLGAISFVLQLYYDFSGYSDMAIGLAWMFGFRLEENFNYPYAAANFSDFWKRWHISLGRWFRDYVYIPLGGSRVGAAKHIRNLFVVWLLTGIWHGAAWTYILWGLYFFVLLLIEVFLVKPPVRSKAFRIFWRILTILLIIFSWVLFNAKDPATALSFWKGMLGLNQNSLGFATGEVIRILREQGVFLLVGTLFLFPLLPFLNAVSGQKIRKVIAVFSPAILTFLFLWGMSFLILGAHNPFLYFNF